ncbi:MAG: FHA domain-containing serine/threonine-protein kinase [Candidatus Methanofastidiosia archaeon]|jgi:serine/threonine-protein kinase
MLHPGDIVKRQYKIEKKLNEGGMGIVYLAKNTMTGKMCVVKEPRFNNMDDSYKLKKLKFEARILMKLNHPHIVNYIDSVDKGNTFYLITEYIHGENLRDLYWNKPLPENKVEKYTLQMLDSLEYLHKRNIIHRDISPDNFMIKNNSIVMIDLGTAREFYGVAGHHWTQVGKRFYTPSEQAKRGEAILQSDIYALGRTMIFLLTGSPPMCGPGTIPSTLRVSDYMCSILKRATHKIPMKRYSSASEMKHALIKKIPRPPPVRRRRPQLIINGKPHFLTRYSYVIGRGAADIEIKDPDKYISRKHARISKDISGQYWIEDGCDGVPSLNGTFVLQHGRYVKKTKWALKDSDIIALCYKPDKGPYITIQYKET